MEDVVTQQTEVQQEEQQTAQQTQEQQTERPKGEVPEWAVRRFGELTAARKAAEQRAADSAREKEQLQQQLAALQNPEQAPQPHPNVQQLAEVLAEHKAKEMVQQNMRQHTIQQRVTEIETAGRKEFGDEFDRAVQNLQISGVGSPEFLEVVTALPGAEKVVRYLGDPQNIEEALRLTQLPPVQMAIEMSKLSGKAVKAFAKPVSNAPPPISTLDGTGKVEGSEPDPKDTAAWLAWRNKTARRR